MNFLKKKGARWEWTTERQQAKEVSKHGLTGDVLLVHYNVNRELRPACDAHSYMALRQSSTMDDGQERSSTYSSRTPRSSERKYAHVKREAIVHNFRGKEIKSICVRAKICLDYRLQTAVSKF